ncbi:MAG: dUTP diphosphatase [Clostridiaceae bacterium]|nr:dUTP diphosphatase [Clostridiaceae bacterium]
MINIKIKLLEKDGRMPHAPCYGTDEAAGADLAAFLTEPVTLKPGDREAVPTGIAIELPQGCCAFVMARSGLALKNGIAPANCVGLIDSDYRGELKVPLANNGSEPFKIENGMRIAQLVVMELPKVVFEDVSELGETERGEGGFGSTGIAQRREENIL